MPAGLTTFLFIFLVASTPLVVLQPTPNPDQTEIINALTNLRNVISQLPNEAFENLTAAEGNRKALCNKIDAVIHQVLAGAYNGAVNKLRNDIENAIKDRIVDDLENNLIEDVEVIIELIEKKPGADKEPPQIKSVSGYPETPEYDERVTVQADVVDKKSGVKTVILSFSVNVVHWTNITMSLVEGFYVAEILAHPYSTTVYYLIYAYDYADNLATSQTYSYVVTDSRPPIISYMEHMPTFPNYNETVSVFANVAEPQNASGVESVTLGYWYDSNWTVIPMSLEGTLFTAVIPALPYGTIVQYQVNASDYAGNWAVTDIYSYNVTDKYPPIARIDEPTPGSVLSGQVSIVVFAYDDNFERAELIINGVVVQSWTSVGTHIFNWNTKTGMYPDGSYMIMLTAYDKENTQSDIIWVTVDNTPPLAAINAPIGESFLKGTVSVNVTGYDANLKKIELFIDNILQQTWTTSGAYTYAWNTLIYSDGTHTIRLAVRDKAGHSDERVITVTVDNTVPTVSIVAPSDKSFLKGLALINVTGYDANFEEMRLCIDGTLVATFDTSGPKTYDWHTSAYSDRSYEINLVALDKAGNSATAKITVTLDNTTPVAEIQSPVIGVYVRGICNVTIYGHDLNLDRMRLYIDESLVETWNVSGTHVYAWNTTEFFDSFYTIKLTVNDKAGNNVEKTVMVTVDNTPPLIGIPKWEPLEPSVNESLNVSVIVAEPLSGSGVKNVTLWFRTDNESQPIEMTLLTSGNWTATILGQNADVTVTFYIEAFDNAENSATTLTYTYMVKAPPAGLPLALLAIVVMSIAAILGTAIYLYQFRRVEAKPVVRSPGKRTFVYLTVPSKGNLR